MSDPQLVFNPAPGWPKPPPGWTPPPGWEPDPSWPPAPEGWQLWLPGAGATAQAPPVAVPPPPLPPTGGAAPAPPPLAPPVTAPVSPAASPPTDGESELETLRRRIVELETALAQARAGSGVVELDDERILQEVGIYRYHHPLETSAEYRDQLADLQERIKDSVKRGDAILASDMFTFNNSLAKGRKMTGDFSKLMLRAYNSEADSCVRALRAGNVLTAKRRLEVAVESIAKLGAMMEMRVNPTYHQLRIEELELTADFLMKVQEEKEAAREERERLREERKAELELAAERERLDKERAHYANTLQVMLANGDDAAVAELTARLEAIDDAIVQNDFRAANIRAGYVYVISNTGAFGHNMVKIGMTRRLDPLDRIRELGDASVPFPFDVHALFFSDDAITLENELHAAFAEQRVNRVNERREFFFATPEQVRDVLAVKVGNLLEFNDHPEATQYLQSMKYWPAST